MRVASACLALQLALASGAALAQAQDKSDAMEKLRACSQLAGAARLECLDKLSRDIGSPPATAKPQPAAEAAPAADNWIVSETTSPFDYSPVAIANATSAKMRLSIQCRGGRTDLVIMSEALAPREDYAVTYEIKDGKPVALPYGAPAAGTGIAIRGDVVRLLAALPDDGDVVFRVASRQGVIVEGRYALTGLKAVRGRMARPCKWPAAGGPTN